MKTESDDGICTLANSLANNVVVQVLNRGVWSAELNDFTWWSASILVGLGFVGWMSFKCLWLRLIEIMLNPGSNLGCLLSDILFICFQLVITLLTL